MDQYIQTIKPVAEAASIATIIGTIAGWLPSIAAGLAVVWYLVVFYDRFVRGRKER